MKKPAHKPKSTKPARVAKRPQVPEIIPPDPVLAQCAEKIRQNLSQAAGLATQVFDRLAAAGSSLIEARERFKAERGWLAWLKREFPKMHRRTAERYMSLVELRAKIPAQNVRTVRSLPAGALYALADAARASPEVFDDAVKELERRAAAGERTRTRDVRRLTVRHRERTAAEKAAALRVAALEHEILRDVFARRAPPERGEKRIAAKPVSVSVSVSGTEVSLGAFEPVLRQWADDLSGREPEAAAAELLAILPPEGAKELVQGVARFLTAVLSAIEAVPASS